MSAPTNVSEKRCIHLKDNTELVMYISVLSPMCGGKQSNSNQEKLCGQLQEAHLWHLSF